MLQVRVEQASEQRRQRAPHLAKVLQKLSVKRFSATSCNRLGTPGEGIRIGEAIRLGRQDVLLDQGAPRHDSFFCSTTGTRLTYARVRQTFAGLCRQAGLAAASPRCRPRLHDFRHYADGWVMCPAVAFPLLGAAELVLRSA